ncbi:MAG TPA: hypothetical protein VGL78_15605 [Solirubrobacteraceae bacterium]|jgi:hypothetical protein
MRFRVAMLAVLASLAVACGGSGGASSNGVASKSPDAIVAAASTAIRDAKSVHVSGSIGSSGSPITLDLNLAAGKGGTGEMSENGLSFRIIVVKDVVYISGSDAFWRHFGGSAAAQLFHGKWLRGPATGQLASVAVLTDLQTLFNKLLASHGTLAKGPTSTVHGQKVVAVNDKTRGGTLYVATTGKPYPIEISKTGPQGGHVIFDRYNEAVTLSAPANSIDVSKLR